MPTTARRTVSPLAAVMLLFLAAGDAGAFDPYAPSNEQLRRTIREVWELQTIRPPIGLERDVEAALRSIKEIEGPADPGLAGLLSTRLRAAWGELERARALGILEPSGFDDERFQTADLKFRLVVAQFTAARTLYMREGYEAAVQTLSEVQTLSRAARRSAPGLASDDVLLMRGKRQKLLLKESESTERDASR